MSTLAAPTPPTAVADPAGAGLEGLVVVPCYDEAARLDGGAFLRFADEHPGWGFVFVDDGSTDGTADLLRRLAEHPRVFALGLPENRGKGEAVRQGVLAALRMRPAYLGYWDADLSTPLAALPHFAEVLDGAPGVELVMGARVQLLGRVVRRSAARHYLGRVLATAVSLVLQMPVYDTQCGAKLFRNTPRAAAWFAEPFLTRWLFDVELLARLLAARGPAPAEGAASPVVELPLREWRHVGGSRIGARDFLRAPLDLLAIRRAYPRRGSGSYGEPAGTPAPGRAHPLPPER